MSWTETISLQPVKLGRYRLTVYKIKYTSLNNLQWSTIFTTMICLSASLDNLYVLYTQAVNQLSRYVLGPDYPFMNTCWVPFATYICRLGNVILWSLILDKVWGLIPFTKIQETWINYVVFIRRISTPRSAWRLICNP